MRTAAATLKTLIVVPPSLPLPPHKHAPTRPHSRTLCAPCHVSAFIVAPPPRALPWTLISGHSAGRARGIRSASSWAFCVRRERAAARALGGRSGEGGVCACALAEECCFGGSQSAGHAEQAEEGGSKNRRTVIATAAERVVLRGARALLLPHLVRRRDRLAAHVCDGRVGQRVELMLAQGGGFPIVCMYLALTRGD